MDVFKESFDIVAGDFASAGEASAKIKSILRMIGLAPALIRRVTISAYEAELNMIIHSHGGVMTLELTASEVRVSCKDTGPGIENIDLAMQEGYSTAPMDIRMMGFGAGMGLSNMKKNSDKFQISSTQQGTVVDMHFTISEQ